MNWLRLYTLYVDCDCENHYLVATQVVIGVTSGNFLRDLITVVIEFERINRQKLFILQLEKAFKNWAALRFCMPAV